MPSTAFSQNTVPACDVGSRQKALLSATCLLSSYATLSSRICAALQLVHCDLKSPNILLKDSSFREAKIADLGLSKYMLENSLLTIQLHGKL